MTNELPEQNTNLKEAVSKLRKNKAALYERMKVQANDPETIKYYIKNASDFLDLDIKIQEQ